MFHCENSHKDVHFTSAAEPEMAQSGRALTSVRGAAKQQEACLLLTNFMIIMYLFIHVTLVGYFQNDTSILCESIWQFACQAGYIGLLKNNVCYGYNVERRRLILSTYCGFNFSEELVCNGFWLQEKVGYLFNWELTVGLVWWWWATRASRIIYRTLWSITLTCREAKNHNGILP